MSEPVLSRKRQDAQDAVETLETFDKHGLPAFVRGVDAEALYFFLALFRTGTLPRAAEQLGISLSSANRMLAKLRTYWDDPLFVRSGFLMQPTTAAKRRYDKVLSFMHVLEDLRRDDELDPRTLSRTVRTACYDNAFALCIASIFADFTARMPHVRLRATQADEHLFDYLREDLLDLVFFARQESSYAAFAMDSCGHFFYGAHLCVREVGAAAVRNLGHFLRPFLLHGFFCRSDGGGC